MKKLLLFTLLTCTFAAQAGEWLTDNETKCKMWIHDPVPKLSIKWTGTCKIGMGNFLVATGEGNLQRFIQGKLESSFFGNADDGSLIGKQKAVITFPTGGHYEGDYLYGKLAGNGVFNWPNGEHYEGDFIDGKRTGKGNLVWPSGDRYEGDFIDGSRIGKGISTLANGDRYEGDFANNVRHGKGLYIWADGRRYEGDHVNFELTGTLMQTNGLMASQSIENLT